MSVRLPKVAKLLVGSVPLVLEVDGGAHKLPLKLAWSMKAVLLMEARLRQSGINVNVIQDLRSFWRNIDSSKLTAAVWATSLQENPEFGDDEGFDVISSFITQDNAGVAIDALWNAFLESLSPERRDALKKAAEEDAKAGTDPTTAPIQ